MKHLALGLSLALLAPAAFAQTIFLDDATVVDNEGVQQTRDIIWTDGQITEQAESLTAPAGSETIMGAWVTSGLFAPMSTLGLTDIGSRGPGNDIASENSKTNVSERVADSFNPRSIYIANTRGRGVTHAVVAPNSSGDSIFAGTGAIIELTGEFDSVVTPDAFVMVDLGERGTMRAGGSRAAAMGQLRSALQDADGFFRRYNDAPDGGDVLSRQDALAFSKAQRGQIPMLIRAHRASDIVNLIRLKDDNPKLDIILVGAAEAWDVADEIADADIRVILDPLHNLPDSFESVGARLDSIQILDAAGVDYAISNLSSLGVANASALAQHAGNAVGDGLSWTKAFAAISSTPADWFGIDTKTMVVWDGDPLQVTSAPIAVSINRQPQSMDSRIKALRDRYNPTSDDTRPYKYR